MDPTAASHEYPAPGGVYGLVLNVAALVIIEMLPYGQIRHRHDLFHKVLLVVVEPAATFQGFEQSFKQMGFCSCP